MGKEERELRVAYSKKEKKKKIETKGRVLTIKKKILAMGLVLAVLATVFACGCVEKESITAKSDEKQVMKLIQKECEYMNKGDWKSLYECYSPGYRDAYPYNAFAEDQNAAMGLIRAFGGKGKFSVEDISVSIKGDIAYAMYVIKLDDDVVESKTEGDEDLFVRYNGTWYDVEEVPSMPGYNKEDEAILRKVEGTRELHIGDTAKIEDLEVTLNSVSRRKLPFFGEKQVVSLTLFNSGEKTAHISSYYFRYHIEESVDRKYMPTGIDREDTKTVDSLEPGETCNEEAYFLPDLSTEDTKLVVCSYTEERFPRCVEFKLSRAEGEITPTPVPVAPHATEPIAPSTPVVVPVVPTPEVATPAPKTISPIVTHSSPSLSSASFDLFWRGENDSCSVERGRAHRCS